MHIDGIWPRSCSPGGQEIEETSVTIPKHNIDMEVPRFRNIKKNEKFATSMFNNFLVGPQNYACLILQVDMFILFAMCWRPCSWKSPQIQGQDGLQIALLLCPLFMGFVPNGPWITDLHTHVIYIFSILSLSLTWKLIPENAFTNIEVGFLGIPQEQWSRPWVHVVTWKTNRQLTSSHFFTNMEAHFNFLWKNMHVSLDVPHKTRFTRPNSHPV